MGRLNDIGAPMTVLFVEESGSQAERLVFTGSGTGYFRVWIVNLLLTTATLGIYSAWAKARTTRYFHSHTKLGASGFAYHGSPRAILRGRMIALFFLAACGIGWNISAGTGMLMMGVLAALLPWLLWKSLQFQMYNTSYRGIRFGCGGTPTRVYLIFLLLPLLTMFGLFVLAPLTHHRIKKFQHEETRFGITYFSFHAGAGAFSKAYACFLAIGIAACTAIVFLFGDLFSEISRAGGLKQAGTAAEQQFLLFALSMSLCLAVLTTVSRVHIQKLVWNRTRLGGHQFRCDLRTSATLWLALTNVAGIALTLGLYIPYARVRMMRYKLQSITCVPAGSLEGFIETTQGIVSATGDGFGEPLEFDLSL